MCASPLRGAAVADATAEYELRLSAFCFRFFLLVLPFLPVRHPCRSGACQCFHRHWLAAASHGAPTEIGGDGSNRWRDVARVQSRIARTKSFSSPRKRGEGDHLVARARKSTSALRSSSAPMVCSGILVPGV